MYCSTDSLDLSTVSDTVHQKLLLNDSADLLSSISPEYTAIVMELINRAVLREMSLLSVHC